MTVLVNDPPGVTSAGTLPRVGVFREGVWSVDLVVAAVVAFTVGRAVHGYVQRRRARAAGRVNDELWARVGALPGLHTPTGPVRVRPPVRHARRDSGSSAVEYGLLVAAIAATIVGVVFALGGVVSAAFSQTNSQVGQCVTDPGQCPSNSGSGGGVPVPGQ